MEKQPGKAVCLPACPRILVIKLRQLGDVMMTGPVIDSLNNAFYGCKIDVLTQDVFADLFRANPRVNSVVSFEPRRSGNVFYYIGFLLGLLKRRYDVVIDLHNNPRSIIMASFVRAGVKIGLKKTHNVFFSHRVSPLAGKHHTIDQLLHILSPLGIKTTNIPDQPVPESLKAELAERFGIKDKGFFIVCPGTNRPEFTRWMPEHFEGVAKHIAQRGYKVVIVTGPGEGELAGFFAKAFSGMRESVTLIDGNLSVLELAALISMARMFIGNNSGPMHISSAVHTDAVGIFGPSSVTAWAVKGAKGIHFYKDVGCNPCRKRHCPYPVRKCLEAITPEMVIERIDDFL